MEVKREKKKLRCLKEKKRKEKRCLKNRQNSIYSSFMPIRANEGKRKQIT
jgi:hypothetical protein